MTSDGISTADWNIVQHLAELVAAHTSEVVNVDASQTVHRLFAALDNLETKYGNLPSITATRADYVESADERARLLKQAYHEAQNIQDLANLTFISSSLAELYVEEKRQASEAERWLIAFESALINHWDEMEYNELKRLSSVFNSEYP